MTSLLPGGAPAPEFVARGSDGRTHRLRELLAEFRVLLIFYPGNNTPG